MSPNSIKTGCFLLLMPSLLLVIPSFLPTTCLALAETEESGKISSLIDQLADDNEIVRLEAKNSLVELGQRAVSALIEALRNDRRSIVRYYSAWALGEIGGKSVRGILSDAVRRESDSEVRDSAVLAVATITLAGAGPSVSPREARKLIDTELISELERMLIESQRSLTRQRSAKILVKFSTKSLLSSLKKELKDRAEPMIRSNICEAVGLLAEIDVQVAISILMKVTGNDMPEVRKQAISQLGKLAEAGEVRRLSLLVSSEKDIQAGKWGTIKLEECLIPLRTFDESVTRRLIKSLKEDHVGEVRRASVDALRGLAQQIIEYVENLPYRWTPPLGFPAKYISEGISIYKRKARESVTYNLDLMEKIFSGYSSSLKKEKQPDIRKEIVLTLGDLSAGLTDLINVDRKSLIGFDRDGQSFLQRIMDNTSAVLLKLLEKEEDILIRREIVSVLAGFDHRQVTRAIAEILTNSQDWELRWRAVESLERQDGRLAEEALVSTMIDSGTDDKLRERIIVALGHLRSKAAVAELILVAVENENLPVRKSAVAALGQIGDTNALAAIIAACQDPDVSLRLTGVSALSRMPGEKATHSLILILEEDEDSPVRIRVVELLAELGDRQALTALKGALADKDASVRKIVVVTIGKIGDKNSLIDVLRVLSDDEDCLVRTEAATVARLLGDKRAVLSLISALRDESKLVRIRAADELSKIRDGRAGGELFRVWETDESPEVRAAAERTIRKLKPFCARVYEQLMRTIKKQETLGR